MRTRRLGTILLTSLTAVTVGLIIGNRAAVSPPDAHASVVTASSIGAGNIHACAGMSDGTARCWGDNHQQQLGHPSEGPAPAPVEVSDLTGAIGVHASNAAYHTCAIVDAATAKCWGMNDAGQLGIGTFGGTYGTPQTVTIPGLTAIATDMRHTCAIGSGGGLFCWGLNDDGQLGDGTTISRATPTAVSGLPGAVSDVDAGLDHTCAVVSGGVWCWGRLVGTSPSQVPGISTAIDVAVGSNHQCAVLSGGTVRCWGSNQWGQLGDGTFTDSWSTPVTVLGLSSAASVDLGGGHSCAVRISGSVACWGASDSGQVGDGTTVNRNTAVTVIGLSSVVEVATGGAFSCARTTGGMVRCWGNNFYGALGDCTFTDRSTPVTVAFDDRYCDSDGDALPDYWEETGDLDFDGLMDLDLPAMGADPLVKDLFVEADWMDCTVSGSDCAPGDDHTEKPDPRALDAVIAHFWCAPERIVIHIDAGPDSIMNPTVDSGSDDPCRTRYVEGPTWGSLSTAGPIAHSSAPVNLTIDTRGPNRDRVFRLALFQHVVQELVPGRPAGGWGHQPGLRTWYGLGAFTYPRPVTNLERWQAEAGTIIHELGHNLGLGHGGDPASVNYKPNYLSSMNYMFGAGVFFNGTIGLRWDYSRAVLDPLNEANLLEGPGLNPDASVALDGNLYGTGWICPSGRGLQTDYHYVGVAIDARSNIDWNCSASEGSGQPAGSCVDTVDNDGDGQIDQFDADCTIDPLGVSQDIGGAELGLSGTLQVFPGHNDWSAVRFDGGGTIGPPLLASLVPGYFHLHADSIDGPQIPDTDGDGMIDVGEAFFGTDPDDTDTDGDGVEDGQEAGLLLTDPLNPDTSGDGYTDGAKLALGTDPLHYCGIMRADVNNDGAVNILDLSMLAGQFLSPVPPAPTRLDQNADSTINILDLSMAAGQFLKPVAACP